MADTRRTPVIDVETMTLGKRAVIALLIIAAAGFAVAGIDAGQPDGCDPERVASLSGGLSYASGHYAGLVTMGASEGRLVDYRRTLEVTEDALREARANCR